MASPIASHTYTFGTKWNKLQAVSRKLQAKHKS